MKQNFIFTYFQHCLNIKRQTSLIIKLIKNAKQNAKIIKKITLHLKAFVFHAINQLLVSRRQFRWKNPDELKLKNVLNFILTINVLATYLIMKQTIRFKIETMAPHGCFINFIIEIA